MKTASLPVLLILCALLCQGCRSTVARGRQYPNADLTDYEARARIAIAEMPVTWNSRTALPENHPWFRPLKEQNLRIAKASCNFDAYFHKDDNRVLLTLSFEDPEEYLPGRYVEFDESTRNLVHVGIPILTGVGGKHILDGYPSWDEVKQWERRMAEQNAAPLPSEGAPSEGR